jgi:predicted Rossmann fold nucleotide-binding protein DprA/Smf involved in DNA uptake
MEYSEALAEKIEARITELKVEIDAHERALAALRGRKNAGAGRGAASATRGAASATNGTAARSRRATARAAGSEGRKASRPRRPRTASAEAVFDALKGGQDQASAIAKQFGVSPAVVRNRLQQLEEAGRVSRTGNRRSTRWRSHAG